MPHDAAGKLLTDGDLVDVRCRVVSISQNRTACNVSLQVEHTITSEKQGETYLPQIAMNSTLCHKVADASDLTPAK